MPREYWKSCAWRQTWDGIFLSKWAKNHGIYFCICWNCYRSYLFLSLKYLALIQNFTLLMEPVQPPHKGGPFSWQGCVCVSVCVHAVQGPRA